MNTSEEMTFFDALPPELREAIRECPVEVSAVEIYKYRFNGMSVEQIIRSIKHTADVFIRERQR